MTIPTSVLIPTKVLELAVSTFLVRFINKVTLAALSYPAMVTLPSASLKPLVQKLPSHFKDTTHFLLQLQKLGPLPDSSILVTLDVSFLYTNIPYREGVEACRHFVNTRPHKSLPTERICDLIHMIPGMNNFTFNHQLFLQIRGTAMGT